MRRQAVYNASADSDLVSILRACGVGRYRVEWCDCRRQIARVTTHVVESDGRVYRARPLRKSKPLKLPPPRYVAPGTPPNMVPYAPEARRLPPPVPRRRPRRPGTT